MAFSLFGNVKQNIDESTSDSRVSRSLQDRLLELQIEGQELQNKILRVAVKKMEVENNAD